MRIALLELRQDHKSATGVRGRAMKQYLENEGHAVDLLSPDPAKLQRFQRSRFALSTRLKRRITGRKTLPHLWDFIADQLEHRIRRGGYGVVVGRGQDMSYVLTRPLDCIKILDMPNIVFLENYYVWGPNLDEVDECFEKEMRIFECADHILCHHELLTEFLIKHFDRNGNLAAKARTVRMGCDPVSRRARFSDEPRLVYAGSYYYIQDPYLLAWLTKESPYQIDCYGPADPNRVFLPGRLNYKGYAPGHEFLADYQLGLVTVSRDVLRQNSPSTKFAYYFAAGLPVLFPEWMKEGYTYPGCTVAYNEENFAEQVEFASRRENWEEMSKTALGFSKRLTWNSVLSPLKEILSSPVAMAAQLEAQACL